MFSRRAKVKVTLSIMCKEKARYTLFHASSDSINYVTLYRLSFSMVAAPFIGLRGCMSTPNSSNFLFLFYFVIEDEIFHFIIMS